MRWCSLACALFVGRSGVLANYASITSQWLIGHRELNMKSQILCNLRQVKTRIQTKIAKSCSLIVMIFKRSVMILFSSLLWKLRKGLRQLESHRQTADQEPGH